MTTPGIIVDVEQGTDRWAALRCGKITASRAADMIATKKQTKKQAALGIHEEMANRRDYRTELLVERLTGVPVEQYVSKEMLFGLAQEPFARAAYEMHEAVFVDQVGFVVHPEIPYFGCSPDGLVGDDGLIQIKVPNRTTHLAWMQSGTIPVEHVPQLLAELAVTGRQWVDFVSFHPEFPEHLQLYIRRYQRNEKLIEALLVEVRHFNAEIEQVLKALPPGPQVIAQVLDWPKEEETF